MRDRNPLALLFGSLNPHPALCTSLMYTQDGRSLQKDTRRIGVALEEEHAEELLATNLSNDKRYALPDGDWEHIVLCNFEVFISSANRNAPCKSYPVCRTVRHWEHRGRACSALMTADTVVRARWW